ncbi:polyadenylate-binding protein 2-like protein, partial [Tanacetum coccineum]
LCIDNTFDGPEVKAKDVIIASAWNLVDRSLTSAEVGSLSGIVPSTVDTKYPVRDGNKTRTRWGPDIRTHFDRGIPELIEDRDGDGESLILKMDMGAGMRDNLRLEAARAIEVLNFTSLNGNAIRIMYSHRDPSVRKSGSGNIFIKNLDKAIDQKALHDTFSAFRNILSCKIATDQVSQSKGYGFVQYNSEEGAHKTIEKLNGMLLNDKQIYVGPLHKQERNMVVDKTKFTNVYVKNLSKSTTDEEFSKVFSEYGPVTSALVMRDADGNSKGFGFVNFENAEDAAKVVDALNG